MEGCFNLNDQFTGVGIDGDWVEGADEDGSFEDAAANVDCPGDLDHVFVLSHQIELFGGGVFEGYEVLCQAGEFGRDDEGEFSVDQLRFLVP